MPTIREYRNQAKTSLYCINGEFLGIVFIGNKQQCINEMHDIQRQAEDNNIIQYHDSFIIEPLNEYKRDGK